MTEAEILFYQNLQRMSHDSMFLSQSGANIRANNPQPATANIRANDPQPETMAF